VSRGQSGVRRSTISGKVTRSWTRSIAGGAEVSEAAAKKTVMPMPISASAKRRSRSARVPSWWSNRSTAK
jgi:hypothetical protein